MNRMHFRQHLIDPLTQKLVFQPKGSKNKKNISNHRSKSKNKKNIYMGQNIQQKLPAHINKIIPQHSNKLIPSIQPVLYDNAFQNMSQKTKKQPKDRQTQNQFKQILNEDIRCINHPDKKGEYISVNNPNTKVCLKCNIALSNNQNNIFLDKQRFFKKQNLQGFKDRLTVFQELLSQQHRDLKNTLQNDQFKFNQHSAYINQSFSNCINKIQEKRRELINNLILAQQTLKKQYQNNFKNIQKIQKSISKYQLDILKNYDDIINDLPMNQFDLIMKQYSQKLQNYKFKIKRMIIKQGLCVYIPNMEIEKLLNKSSVEYYQPFKQKQFSKTKERVVCHSFDNKFFEKNRPSSSSSKTKEVLNATTDYYKNLCYLDKQNINIDNIQCYKKDISNGVQCKPSTISKIFKQV